MDRPALQVNEQHEPRVSAAKVFAFAKDMLESSRQVRSPLLGIVHICVDVALRGIKLTGWCSHKDMTASSRRVNRLHR